MIEDCLKELRTAIQTNLPALLNAEDAAYAAADAAETGIGAAIVLADIATIRFEEFNEQALQTLPAVALVHRGTQEIYWISAHVTLVHTIDVKLLVADTNPIVLERRHARTAEALRRMLSANVEGTGVTSDPIYQVDVVDSVVMPLFRIEHGLAKGSLVTIRGYELEDRPRS